MKYFLSKQIAELSNLLEKQHNIYKVLSMVLINHVHKFQLSNFLS